MVNQEVLTYKKKIYIYKNKSIIHDKPLFENLKKEFLDCGRGSNNLVPGFVFSSSFFFFFHSCSALWDTWDKDARGMPQLPKTHKITETRSGILTRLFCRSSVLFKTGLCASTLPSTRTF